MDAPVLLAVRGRRVHFALRAGGPVRLSLYTVLGQEAVRLFDGTVADGQAMSADLPDALAQGIYFVRLSSPEHAATIQLVR